MGCTSTGPISAPHPRISKNRNPGCTPTPGHEVGHVGYHSKGKVITVTGIEFKTPVFGLFSTKVS